jgi:type II secretory pathway pseudopilin PulG
MAQAVAPAVPGALPPTSGKAVASLVCGCLFFLFPSAIAAIVLGHLSLSEIKKSAGRLKGEGLAVAGLVLGYMGLGAIPIILIVAAIAIPNLLRARIAANESSAVNGVTEIGAAEATYSEAHPEQGFSCDLPQVASYGKLNAELGSGQRHGYVFALQNCAAEQPGGPNTKFQVVAYPMNRNQTGVRAFCSDESGAIRFDGDGSPQACLEGGAPLQ